MTAAASSRRVGNGDAVAHADGADGAAEPRGQREALPTLPDAIVAEARSWIGTPYHHQASLKGVGCDCIGLIRGVWRAAIGPEPEAMPAYSRDWGEAAGAESLLELGRRYFTPVAVEEMAPGDVVVFRMRQRRIAKHCGILTSVGWAKAQPLPTRPASRVGNATRCPPYGTFVHAQERVPVAEVAMSDWWRRRIVGAFRFPGTGRVGKGAAFAHADPAAAEPRGQPPDQVRGALPTLRGGGR